ncbi:unnamed protein product [Hydatigera taeniaeformis]|uniref:PPIase cyclophilin-type domain-containing protein n=1 Tax=Hydatigena taeniaeformis TaxID=6205 RepID=A0A0R3X0J8_HYDTA|nr:unnamed protein product [Hydatigera taeniaeformis]
MSNIYITEPATNGKVILTTTVGDIEVELWSKETPLACRNFVQLCMEGYYDDTAFHRLVKGFIVQGGDPTGTGDGGESIYDGPFKTESHSRLSFNRRGLLGMACPEPNCNGSQFFFTLGEALELNGKHTLFGRVVGVICNRFQVILNPYDDIVPRQIKPKKYAEADEKIQPTAKATKNFSLLSFGSEAEEEEEISSRVEEKFRSRGKSAHDLVNDESLSKEAVVITEEDAEITAKVSAVLEAEAEARRRRRDLASRLETEEELRQKQKRLEDLRAEADAVRRDIARTMRSAKERATAAEAARQAAEMRAQREADELRRAEAWEAEQRKNAAAGISKPSAQPMVDNFADEVASYRSRAKKNREVILLALYFVRKDREEQTMNLLSRFKSRLLSALEKSENDGSLEATAVNDNEERDENKTLSADPTAWVRCKLVSEEPAPARRVMDPSLDDPDRHDLYDPRNPLNLRKRGAVTDESGGDDKGYFHNRNCVFIGLLWNAFPINIMMRYVAATLLTFLIFTALTNDSMGDHIHYGEASESHSHAHGNSYGQHQDHLRNHGHLHAHYDIKPRSSQIWVDTIGAVVGISVAPFILLFLVPDLNKRRELLKILLGFAAGGLLGDAFLHLIPHALAHMHGQDHRENGHDAHGHSHSLKDGNTCVFLCVIGGIFVFLCIDKCLRFVRSGHNHSHGSLINENGDKKQKNAKAGDSKGSVSNSNGPNKSKTKNKLGMNITGYLNLAADFTHNVTDGIAIAGSFLISRNVGYVTTLTVLVHELPHEIGDYAILIKSGCGTHRAMLLQLVTALGAVLGACLSLLAAGVGMDSKESGVSSGLSPELITTCLLPFTAGGFIYIALASVLPDLLVDYQAGDRRSANKISRRIGQAAAELTAVILGIALMAVIGLFE